MTANRYAFHNLTSLNQQAAAILKDSRIPFAPTDELAALVLVRSAIERGQIEIPTLPEPLLLIAKLQADPDLAMSLMTESEPGVSFEIMLPPTIEEAAATILEELVASLTARTPPGSR